MGRDDGIARKKRDPSARTLLHGQLAPHASACWLPPEERSRLHQVTEQEMDGVQRAGAMMVGRSPWEDMSAASGWRLLLVESASRQDGGEGANADERWARRLLGEYANQAELAAGGIGIATAIRTGKHTRHVVQAAEAVRGASSSAAGSSSDAPGPSYTGPSLSDAGEAISVFGLVLALSPEMGMSSCVVREGNAGQAAVERQLRKCLERKTTHTTSPHQDHHYGKDEYSAAHSVPRGQPLPNPAAAVLFTCNGRGREFHGEPNAEARAVAAALPGVPFAGFFAGGEYGPSFAPIFNATDPINGRHQFSSVVAMIS